MQNFAHYYSRPPRRYVKRWYQQRRFVDLEENTKTQSDLWATNNMNLLWDTRLIHLISSWSQGWDSRLDTKPSKKFNPLTQKHPATSPKPSSLTLHVQTPIVPHSYYRYRDQRIGARLHNLHRTRGPVMLSSLTEGDQPHDQKPCDKPPMLLDQSDCAMDNWVWNRGENLLSQRSNRGSLSAPPHEAP